MEQWGYSRKSVCHGAGEYARDEDGDGFYEVHVNTMEGFWSLLRSWLRPHRGISQAYLPIYLGFFEFVHNAKKRGKALFKFAVRIDYELAPRNPLQEPFFKNPSSLRCHKLPTANNVALYPPPERAKPPFLFALMLFIGIAITS